MARQAAPCVRFVVGYEQVAKQEIAQANSEKVKAQQDLHTFQIEQMRVLEEMRHADKKAPPSPDPAASRKAAESDGLQGIISGLEQQKIGEIPLQPHLFAVRNAEKCCLASKKSQGWRSKK